MRCQRSRVQADRRTGEGAEGGGGWLLLPGDARADARGRGGLDAVGVVTPGIHHGRGALAALGLTVEVALARGPPGRSRRGGPKGAVRSQGDLWAKRVVRAGPVVARVLGQQAAARLASASITQRTGTAAAGGAGHGAHTEEGCQALVCGVQLL